MVSKKAKFLWIFTSVVVLGVAIFIYFHFFFVYNEGVRSGHLNKVERRGYIFKTNEGRIIQTGFHSEKPGTMGTNFFEFSVVDEKIAEELMMLGQDKEVNLHYKQYLGVLPWRGESKYIVDKILTIKSVPEKGEIPLVAE